MCVVGVGKPTRASLKFAKHPTTRTRAFLLKGFLVPDRGYVKLWRKSLDSATWKNHDLWRFWSWCLLKASYKQHRTMVGLQTVDLQPGQFVFGRKAASEELGLHESKIYRMQKWLEIEQQITVKSNNKFSIISIINWNTYQSDNGVERTTNEQQMNNKRTTNEHKQERKEYIVGQIPDPTHVRIKAPPYEQIIQILNETCKRNFDHTSKKTRQLIKARWNEPGRKLDDFITVIRKKNDKWGSDPRMMDYLRPSTLFGSKFAEYLAEPDARDYAGRVTQKTASNIEGAKMWLEQEGEL